MGDNNQITCFIGILKRCTGRCLINDEVWGFPGTLVAKNSPANAGDKGSFSDIEISHMLQSN